MGTPKKTRKAGRAAALPQLPLSFVAPGWPPRFVSRAPVGDETCSTVGHEYLVELVDALKEPGKGIGACDMASLVTDIARARLEGDDVAHWLLYRLSELAAALIRDHGNPQWTRHHLAFSRHTAAVIREQQSKEKAERIARLAAGRKAAAERRALAVLNTFPAQVEAHA
ncbi:MAG: hypothetical protein RIQ60_3588 [Pseudomonadota bacterium]|jgi:hypothetical protein